ncbi:receptor-type tyrosine-protein phosphatase epsilon-like isoform X2 [Haliotis cracherodii]
MSTAFWSSPPASTAVNGQILAHKFEYSVVTNTNQPSAWWKVDLQTQVQSARVTLYFSTYYKSRRNGVQLYTSMTNSSAPEEGNICHSVTGRPNGTDIPDVMNVTCPETWRYLTLYTETDNDGYGALLEFVEVQVWKCPNETYGFNCNKTCGHCANNNSCHHVTGICPDGCQAGWKLDLCQKECPNGTYGFNCNKTCGHCAKNDTCHHVNGSCPDGCQAGWKLDLCQKECPNGTYGVNCNKTCGHCANNNTCHHVDGICPDGCQAGWKLDLCQKGCDNGKFGLKCERDCGHCNGTCDAVDGRCPWGCTEGYNGSHCSVKLSLLNGHDESEFPVSAVVGAVAGILAAIVVVVVVVVIVRRRRQRFHDDVINKQLAELHTKVQENSIYENVALDESLTVTQEPPIKAKPATLASSGTPRDARDKDQEEEDFNEDVQSPDNCYYNTGADPAIRDVAVPELASTVATLRERKDGFEKEYHRLPAGFMAPYQDSQKPENSGKNKFRGYYPYDHNRVRLTPLADTPGSDYINASLMDSYNQRKTYIASQAPNKKTVGDFWRMIWEHSCSAVVMLTGLTEESRVKCERYWPTDGAMIIGLFKIEVEVTQSRANFTTRYMKVTSNPTGESRTVVQFHFTSWPDHGVPDTLALVNYIWLVRQIVAETDGPLLVHCSAGIGRTGTYIAVDSLIDQARGEGVVDVFGYVSAMRGQRKNMIQTPAQYECVFLCLVEMTTYGCTSMDVSNYTNSYSCSGIETTMDGKTFRQLSEMLVLEMREDAPTRHRMWVDGNADFIVRVGPSLTCLRGYLQASAPPPELVKLLWKLVEENDVHNIIVVTPDMGLVEAEGRSKTHGEITLTTTSQTSLSTDVTMNNLQLATKAGSPRQIKMVDVNASLTMEVLTSHLLNHAQLQEISTQPHPVVVVHRDTDRKLAVSLCIMGNILSGIREDTCVDVIGHVRTFLRCCPDFQLTQSDVQMFHDFAQQCILRTDPANTYANI